MATEFITAQFPTGDRPKTQTRAEMRERVHGFIREGERARLREIGEDFGPWRSEADLVERVLERVDRMGVGPRLVIQRQKDMEALAIREVTATPDLGAAPEVEDIHGMVWDQFDVRSGGLWLCRFIDGTSTVSRHGYQGMTWKGAAEDVFPNTGGAKALEDIAQFVIARTKTGRLEAQNVIWLQRIWTAGQGERVYGGVTHYHVHFDVLGGSACRP